MSQPRKPDLDTIASRLRTRHEAIERALESALARIGMTRASIARLARLGEQPEVLRRLEQTRLELEAMPATVEVRWEELCRPSLTSLGAQCLRSLRRA